MENEEAGTEAGSSEDQPVLDWPAAGKAFLAANAQKEGVVVQPSGLQYEILREGTGRNPGLNSTVKAHYAGRLHDGKEFDSSYKRNEPFVTSVGGVIPGWQEALQLMKVGAKWRIFIPPELAYGGRAMGNVIPAHSVLIFDMELLEIIE